jgi:hypothetical protein
MGKLLIRPPELSGNIHLAAKQENYGEWNAELSISYL